MVHRTLKHSGDLGDIIFSLPTVRALGGGILYLDPAGGKTEPHVRITCFPERGTRLTATSIEWLKPLLLLQEYITDVRYWSGEAVDYNLDIFRSYSRQENLADSHLAAFRLPSSLRDTAWLKVDQPQAMEGFRQVISRTMRKHGNDQFWEAFLREHQRECLFVGLEPEHEEFERRFGVSIRYYPTPTALDLARVIAGCSQFVGNPSFANAVAEGLKQNKILEVYRDAPNEIFVRPGAQYI